MLKSLNERLAEIQREFAKNTDRTDDEIVEICTNYCPKWESYLATESEVAKLIPYRTVVQYNDIKYLVNQDTYPMISQAPDDTGLLAMYRPYREKGTYEWLYGEYCVIGDYRTYDNNLYVAIQDPNTNIYSPNLVSSIWQLVEEAD